MNFQDFNTTPNRTITRFVKGVFFLTGTYNDMYYHPYQANATINDVITLQSITRNGTMVDAGTLSSVASGILTPSMDVQPNAAPVKIANGWSNNKLGFMIELEHQLSTGTIFKHYLTGYTDHPGYSQLTGRIVFDPNMRLYFNSSFTVNVVKNPLTGYYINTMCNANHIIAGDYNPSFIINNNNSIYKQRPEDLSLAMQTNDTIRGDLIDTRLMLTESVAMSRYTNGLPSSYLSKVLQGAVNAKRSEVDSHTDFHQHMESFREPAVECVVSDDYFLSVLLKETNLMKDGCVTLAQVYSMDPTFDDRCMLSDPNVDMSGLHHVGMTEYMYVKTAEARVAHAIAAEVPAIMIPLMIVQVGFMSSNIGTLDGSVQTVIVKPPQSFAEGMDLSSNAQEFVNRLTRHVLMSLINIQHVMFSLECYIDIVGDTRICVSVNGGSRVDFCFPTWASGLFTPVLSDSEYNVRNLANGMVSLAEATVEKLPTNVNSVMSPISSGNHFMGGL